MSKISHALTLVLALLLTLLAGSKAGAQTLNYQTPVENTGDYALNPQNVMWLAFLLDEKADRIHRAKAYLQVRELQRYASSMHDEQALLAEAQLKADEIDAELKRIDRKRWYQLDVPALAVAVEGRKVTLSTAFNTGLYSFPTDFGAHSEYFPPLYEFIVPNVAAFQDIEVSQGRASELRELIAAQGAQTAHVRVELELVKFQQGRRFQAVMRRLQWFADFQRTKLIAETVDKRPAAKLIAAGMLSEGATFEASPEHAFTVAGERMLETIPMDHHRKRNCNEAERERGHRVFVCTEDRDWMKGLPATVRYHYVGGRLVQVRVRLRDGAVRADATTQANLSRQVMRELSAPPSVQMDQAKWDYGGTHFMLDRGALDAGATDRDFLVAIADDYQRLQKGEPGTEVIP